MNKEEIEKAVGLLNNLDKKRQEIALEFIRKIIKSKGRDAP